MTGHITAAFGCSFRNPATGDNTGVDIVPLAHADTRAEVREGNVGKGRDTNDVLVATSYK